MSTWLDQFQAHLEATKASRQGVLSATAQQSSVDIAHRILAMQVADSKPFDYTALANKAHESALSKAGHGVLSGGQRVLDVLSRGMYASANLADFEVNVAKHGDSMSNWDVLKGGAGAIGQGLAGQKKTTYADVLDHAGVKNGVAKGVLGFAGDVLLDPTTYIGVGAAKSLVGGAARLAGKEIPKFARAKNAFGTATVLTEKDKAAADLVESGTAKVHDSNVQRILNAVNGGQQKALPYRVVPEMKAIEGRIVEPPANRALGSSATKPNFIVDANGKAVKNDAIHYIQQDTRPAVDPGFAVNSAGMATRKPWNNSTQRIMAEANLSQLTRHEKNLLSGIEVSRYPKGTKIDPLHRSTVKETPQKYMDTVTEQLPTKPVDDVIKAEIRKIQPKGNTLALFGRSGHAAKIDVKTGSQIKTQGLLHLRQLHNIITQDGGKIPEHLKNVYVEQGGKLTPLPEVVAHLHGVAADHEIFGMGETVTKQVEKTRMIQSSVHEKISPSEVPAWIAKHKDILHPEDLTYILRGGSNPKNVATRIEKVLAKTDNKDFKDLAELQAAIKSKSLTAKGVTSVKFRRGEAGVKSISQLQAKIDKARKAVIAASENPTPAKVKAAKTAVADAKKAAPETVKAEPTTLPGSANDPFSDNFWQTPAFVQEAQKKVNDVLVGGKTFAKPVAQLNQRQATVVEDALKHFNNEEFVKPLDKATYAWKTNRGTKRDSPVPGVGRARNHRGINKFSQLTLGKKIISGAAAMVRGTDKAARPAAMYEATMPMLLAAEQRVLQEGMPLILGKSATGFPLSMHDILSSLNRGFVEKHFFTPEWSLHVTQMADVAEQAVRHSLGQIDDASMRQNIELLLTKEKNSPLAKRIAESENPHLARNLANTIANEFKGASSRIMNKLTDNSAAASIKVGEETKALSDEAINAFMAVVSDPKFSAAEVMDAALHTNRLVDNSAKARDIPVSGVAEGLAKQEAAAHAASTVPMPTIATAAKGADEYAKAATTSATAKVSEKLADSAYSEGRHLMEEMQINTLDMGVNAEFGLGVGFFRAFAPHLGNDSLRPILTERMSVAQSLSKQFTSQLAKVHSMHPTADLKEALKALQEGKEATTPAMQSMQMVMKELFNIGDSKYGLISRNGISADHLAKKFQHFGIGDQKYQLNRANIDQSWKAWDIEDPLDFVSKFHAAVSSAVAEKQLGADVSRLFGEVKPREGWVQIRDSKGASPLASLIDTNKFYPPDVARQMHMLDKTLVELAQPNASNKFLRVLDSALHSYKAGVTIYRPGHHVRNLIGDMWLSSMDGVSAGAYKRAAAVLGTRKSQYADFDALRALQDAYSAQGTIPKTVLNLTHNGKKVSLTSDQVYRMAFDSGVLPDYSVLEDIAFGATQQADKVAEMTKKLSPLRLIGQQGKVHKAASAASEYRDHYVRIAHFIHAMEDGGALKGKTLDEALKNASFIAGNRVRKWHPDGSDLSAFEKKYMRRSVLFYSWVRKAIPLVVETAVTRPGKFMAYPKAMQNIAAMHGINLDGMSNPFPTDQLFPSYIADSTQGPTGGEAGSYAGIRPGIPSMDVMDDFASSPLNTLRSVMGSMNPLGKIPVETATGTQLRTGTPIVDKTDYIDAQIPGANYIDKLAGGRSLSSGFTQQNHQSPVNAGYLGNPNTPGTGGTDFINWLLGLGLTDYSKPSSIKSAQREQGGR